MVTEANVCEQLAKSRTRQRSGWDWTRDLQSHVQHRNHYAGSGTIGTLLLIPGWDVKHTNATVGGALARSGTWLVDATAKWRVSVIWRTRSKLIVGPCRWLTPVSSVMFPFIRIRFRNRFRKTVSVLPFRNAIAVMPLPFRTFCAVNHSRPIEANGRVELSIGPAGPVVWRASFPRFQVGGAPGLLATALGQRNKIERDSIWMDERKRNAGYQAWADL